MLLVLRLDDDTNTMNMIANRSICLHCLMKILDLNRAFKIFLDSNKIPFLIKVVKCTGLSASTDAKKVVQIGQNKRKIESIKACTKSKVAKRIAAMREEKRCEAIAFSQE